MKKSGFTLVELLAVMALLSIIALLSFPIVLSAIKKAKSGISSATTAIMQNAVETCISEKKCLSCTSSDTCTISVGTLVSNGYITKGMLGDKVTEEYTIFLKKENDKLVISSISNDPLTMVCTPSTALAYGVGKLYSSTTPYAVGTEYKCNPGDGKTRTFYVLKENSDETVTLIMALNYGKNTTLAGARTYMANLKSTWVDATLNMPDAYQLSSTYTPSTQTQSMAASYVNINLNCPSNSCAEKGSTDTQTLETISCYWTANYWQDSSGMFDDWAFIVNSNNMDAQKDNQAICGYRPVITIEKVRIASN